MRVGRNATIWLILALLVVGLVVAGWLWRRPKAQPMAGVGPREAWEAAGAEFVLIDHPRAGRQMPTFVLRQWPERGVSELPTPPAPFGLILRDMDVTEARLEELAGREGLTLLLRGEQITDAALKALREAGLLHALDRAEIRGGHRPARPEEVHRLDLTGTQVTAAGLRELAGLKNLTTLLLADEQLTDAALESLAGARLLHALVQSGAETGRRPAGPEEVTTLSLFGEKPPGRVTARGLKSLKGLKNLRTLRLRDEQVTDAALAALREVGLLHALDRARAAGGGRPSSLDAVVSLDLRATRVTEAGLKELRGLRKLTTLHLPRALITNRSLRALNDPEVGLLHALTRVGSPPIRPRGGTQLDLRGTRVTEAGLRELAGLKKLAKLLLADEQVTDAALAALADVRLLHTLCRAAAEDGKRPARPEDVVAIDLSRTKLSEGGLETVANLKNLTSLDLRESQVTGAGLKKLAPLKKLTRLTLSRDQVTDEALWAMNQAGVLHALDRATAEYGGRASRPREVVSLDLHDTKVTAGGLKALGPLKRLNILSLSPQQITDASLKALNDVKLLHALTLASGADGKRPTGPADVTALDLHGTPVTDAGLTELTGLVNLTSLRLGPKGKITEAALKALAGSKKLTTLTLARVQVTDEALKPLRRAGLLHVLSQARGKDGGRPGNADEVVTFSLEGTAITHEGVGELAAGLKNLAHLPSLGTTDDSLKTLKNLHLLHALDRAGAGLAGSGLRPASQDDVTTLNLRGHLGSSVTPAGLKALGPLNKDLKCLRTVELFPDQVTDEMLVALKEVGLLHALHLAGTGAIDVNKRPTNLEEVTTLALDGTRVTDEGLKTLVALPNLTWLNLRNTKVTDKGLKELARLKDLATLNLENTSVSDEGLKELATALPRCQVVTR